MKKWVVWVWHEEWDVPRRVRVRAQTETEAVFAAMRKVYPLPVIRWEVAP